MRRSRVLAGLTLAAAVATVPSAQAKVSCEGTHPPAEIRVEGIPTTPVADTQYHASLDVPRAAHANPAPLVMFMRCSSANDYPSFAVDLPGAGRAEFPLRFSEPGRYRAALMDRGGTFHSLGTIDVAAAGEESDVTSTGGDATAPVLAGAGLLAAALLFAARSRR